MSVVFVGRVCAVLALVAVSLGAWFDLTWLLVAAIPLAIAGVASWARSTAPYDHAEAMRKRDGE